MPANRILQIINTNNVLIAIIADDIRATNLGVEFFNIEFIAICVKNYMLKIQCLNSTILFFRKAIPYPFNCFYVMIANFLSQFSDMNIKGSVTDKYTGAPNFVINLLSQKYFPRR